MIYLDASALVKLLFEEAESEALEQWIGARVDVPKVTSELSIIEVLRTCRRVDGSATADGRRVLAGLDLIPVTRTVLEQSAVIGAPALRSLDAIHLASARSAGTAVTTFVTYDERLARAAEEDGLAVIGPV